MTIRQPPPSFDLIDEPWIPVTIGGRQREVSLREALLDGHRIDALDLSDPLQSVALLRQVLLPVLLHAEGPARNRQEWKERWDRHALDADRINAYLDDRSDRFGLFDPVRPFAQVAGLRAAGGETRPVSLLILSLSSGNNVPLFCARTEAEPPDLTCSQAARALVTAHCWDTAAIKTGAVGDPRAARGKTTGNPTGPLGQLGIVVPLGNTLARTLVLNTRILSGDHRRGDRPQWDARAPATPRWEKGLAPRGLLDLLTWQSRRIRLVPTVLSDGRTVVREAVLCAGDRPDGTDPTLEPHTRWRRSEKPRAGRPERTPLRHPPGKDLWRGMTSLLALREPDGDSCSTSLLLRQLADQQAGWHAVEALRVDVLAVGAVYGNQSAVVEDVMTDRLPLPVAALDPDSETHEFMIDLVGEAEELCRAANTLGNNLRAATGGDPIPWDRGERLGDRLVHRFAPVVHRLLAGLLSSPDRVEDAVTAWRDAAAGLADGLLEEALTGASPQAFTGRGGSERPGMTSSLAEIKYRAAVRDVLGTPAGPGPRVRADAPGAPHPLLPPATGTRS